MTVDSAGSTAFTGPVLDVRTYELVPGGRPSFDRVFRVGVLPMRSSRPGRRARPFPRRRRPLLPDARVETPTERDAQLGAFYRSEEWRGMYRGPVMSLIAGYHVVVMPLAGDTYEALVAQALSEPVDL